MGGLLCVHGVGGHAGATWKQSWKEAIERGQHNAGLAPEQTSPEFFSYDAVFERFGPPSLQEVGSALAILLRSGLGLHRSRTDPTAKAAATRSLRDLRETLRWTAEMVVQWAEDEALRKELRSLLYAEIRRHRPAALCGHSLGSLIAYDALVHAENDLGPHERCETLKSVRTLVTLGSQLGNPFVRGLFGGRVVVPHAAGEAAQGNEPSLAWFHLYNHHDDVFTARLRLGHVPSFHELDTPFDLEGPGDHDATSYLSHEAARALWRHLDPSAAAPRVGARSIVRSVARPPDRRALIIGIDQYPNEADRLEGCVNDAYLVSAALQESTFRPEEIRVLLDDRATQKGIRERLEWLLVDTKPGDWRFLYYSGHGGRIAGYGAKEEVDHLDETLVPWDFDWSLETAVTDDEMHDLYAQLPYEALFLAVFDCCHSGGMSRGASRKVRGMTPPDDVRHRELRWDAQAEMWVPRDFRGDANRSLYRHSDFLKGARATGRFGRAVPLRRLPDDDYDAMRARLKHHGPYMPLVIQACREEQLSYEYRHGVTSYGAFTHAFVSALRKYRHQGRSPSFAALTEEVRDTLHRLGYPQTPQLSGPGHMKNAPVPWIRDTSTPRQVARAELLGLLDLDLERELQPDAVVQRITALEEEFPGLLQERPDAEERRADQAGKMRQTFAERWNLDWNGEVERPQTLSALASLLAKTRRSQGCLRVVGAARSLSRVSEPLDRGGRDVQAVSLIELSEPAPFVGSAGGWNNPPRAPAFTVAAGGTDTLYRCEAGRSVRRVIDDLFSSGRSLPNHGSGSFQGIVGLIATGSHGTGASLPPLSGLVRAVTVLVPGPRGDHYELIMPADERRPYDLQPTPDGKDGIPLKRGSETVPVRVVVDTAVFDATVVGLGCLGIVVSVTLQVEPKRLYLREERKLTTWKRAARTLLADVQSHRHFELQIVPHTGAGKVGQRNVGRGNHLCQVVTRDEVPDTQRSGGRSILLALARMDAAKALIGGRIRKGLRRPDRLSGGVVKALTGTAGHTYTDYIAKTLLLELKYVGLGIELAVPLHRAVDAANEILRIARRHDRLAQRANSEEALLSAWRETPPFTAVVTMRFAKADKAMLSMAREDPQGNPAGVWCIFEIGMLGAPALERQLRQGELGDRELHRLYRAYDAGRRGFFARLQDKLETDFGARAHWGLVNATTGVSALQRWGDGWVAWKKRFDEVNHGGLFDSRYTDQLGISRAGVSATVRGPCRVVVPGDGRAVFLQLRDGLAWRLHDGMGGGLRGRVGVHVASAVSTTDPVIAEIALERPPQADGTPQGAAFLQAPEKDVDPPFDGAAERIEGQATYVPATGRIDVRGAAGQRLLSLMGTRELTVKDLATGRLELGAGLPDAP